METGESTTVRDPVERLADEYLARRRGGEHPTPEEYAARFPEHAQMILELFPALELMEQLKPGHEDEHPAGRSGSGPPERMGDYRILRVLGCGGMGIVYEAIQESLGRHVALKVLPRHARVDATQHDRFRLEARSVARLHHTNIVPVFAVGEHQGVPYYAMQFIAGHSLETVLQDLRRLRGMDRRGRADAAEALATTVAAGASVALARSLLTCGPDGGWATCAGPIPGAERSRFAPKVEPNSPVLASPVSSDGSSAVLTSAADGGYFRAAARIGLQVAEALVHAHDRGVLHRDIKPSNLLLDAEGRVWVTDFGLAKLEGSDGPTRTGDVVGTLRYMAPERFEGWSDPRSDVYGLGATLYELLTLHPAFDGVSRARLVQRVLHATPLSPRRLDPRIPRDLETVVLKAISKEPSDRYPTARALADDLGRFLEDRPVRARRARPAERSWRWCRRNPTVAALLALVIGLTLTLAAGSTVAAVRLKRSRDEATARLWESYRAEARARRAGHQAGQRFDSLESLTRAARIRASPTLRDELVASLALVDLRAAECFAAAPAGHGPCAFDGRLERYAFSDRRGRISVRSTRDDREVVQLDGPGAETTYVKFLPSGHKLLAVYNERVRRRLVVWDLDTARPLWNRVSPDHGMAASPDGHRLAVAGFDGSIDIFETTTGRSVRRLWFGNWVDRYAFDPSGLLLAVTTAPEQEVRVLDVDRNELVWMTDLGSRTRGIAWRGDGRVLAVGCDDYRIHVWDMERKRLLSTLVGHENAVTELEFLGGGDLLVSSTWDNTTKVWDPLRGTMLVEAPGTLLQASPDGRRLGLLDFELRPAIWELAPRREFRLFHHAFVGNQTTGPRGSVESVDIHNGGRLLASAAEDGVRLWDLDTGQARAFLDIGPTGTVRFSPDGSNLLTASDAGLRVWPLRFGPGAKVTLGRSRQVALESSGTAARAAWDGSNRRIAAFDRSRKRAIVWDIGPPRAVFRSDEQSGLDSVAISPDGRWVATATWLDRDVKVWDTVAGCLAWTWPCESARVAFSPDGRWLVISTLLASAAGRGAPTGGYHLCHVGDWKPGVVVPSPNRVGGAVFTHDGRLMAIDHADGRIQLIDPDTAEVYATLDPPAGSPRRVLELSLSPDGHYLAAATAEGAIQVWDLWRLRAELLRRGLDWSGSEIGPIKDQATSLTILVEETDWFAPARRGAEQAAAGHWGEAASSYARAVARMAAAAAKRSAPAPSSAP